MRIPVTSTGMVATVSKAGGTGGIGRGPLPQPGIPRKKSPKGFASLIIKGLPKWKRDAVWELSAKTRVPYSEYLREAVEDVLRKYGAL